MKPRPTIRRRRWRRDVARPRRALDVLGAGAELDRLESLFLDRLAHVGRRQQGRQVTQARPLGGVVHLGLDDAGVRPQRLLQPAGIIVVGQTLDRKIDVPQGDIVPRAPDSLDEPGRIQLARVVDDAGALGGQADRSLLYAVQPPQIALDRRDTVGARHPRDRQRHVARRLGRRHGALLDRRERYPATG